MLVYLRKTYVGPLGVVLPRPRRKPDYEFLREPRGRDSGWRGPGLLILGILLARVATPLYFCFNSLACCYLFLASSIYVCARCAKNYLVTLWIPDCTIPHMDQLTLETTQHHSRIE